MHFHSLLFSLLLINLKWNVRQVTSIEKFEQVFQNNIVKQLFFNNTQTSLILDKAGKLWKTTNNGESWNEFSDIPDPVNLMRNHDHSDSRALFLTSTNKLYITKNNAESVEDIKLPTTPNSLLLPFFDFHPDSPDYLLFLGGNSKPVYHTESYFYNGKDWSMIETWAQKCMFGKDSKFDPNGEYIFCTSYSDKASLVSQEANRGASSERNPLEFTRIKIDKSNRKVLMKHVIEFYPFEYYMAVATELENNLGLLTTTDGENFSPAVYPPDLDLRKQAFTILESSTHRIFLDVSQSSEVSKEYGSLFVSDSNGVYFQKALDNTNRASDGSVDFEKLQGVSGIILANQVSNIKELEASLGKKKVVTKISKDDGRTWNSLEAPGDLKNGHDDWSLHLHGKTELSYQGPILSSKYAVGLVVGVGNVGKELAPLDQCNTFLSLDSGKTWKEVQKGPYFHYFLNHGSVIVLVDDGGPTKELMYSFDNGKTFSTYQFSNDPVRVAALSGTPNLSSTKLMIVGLSLPARKDAKQVIISVDFAKEFEGKCQHPADFDSMSPREGCFLGLREEIWRKKDNKKCEIEKLVVTYNSNNCECTEDDYDCAPHYWWDSNRNCALSGPDPKRPDPCNGKYISGSGYIKSAATSCSGGPDKTKGVEKSCDESSGSASFDMSTFSTEVKDYIYFRNSEVVLLRDGNGNVYRSSQAGKYFKKLDNIKDSVAIIQLHPTDNDTAYFITSTKTTYYTKDKGATIESFSTPVPPGSNDGEPLSCHPEEKDWLLFMGMKDCETLSGSCHNEIYLTKNHGRDWEMLETYVKKCLWGRRSSYTTTHRALIVCSSYKDKSGSQNAFFSKQLQLISTESFHFSGNSRKVLFESIVGYGFFEEFLVVAELPSNSQTLKLQVSLDGEEFAEARFPPGVYVNQLNGFTVLESKTGSMIVDIQISDRKGLEYGTLLGSNSNGTFFSLSLANTNRNREGFVDFEKMTDELGIAIANSVSNPNEVTLGLAKKIKSYITYDDGVSWEQIPHPKQTSTGADINCQGDCYLHLHGYTEVQNQKNLFSSMLTPGVMVGLGNVGAHLDSIGTANTYLTVDAGKSWKEIRQGPYIHQFGYRGSILLLAPMDKSTDHILYSIDHGNTFSTLNFPSSLPVKSMNIREINTSPDIESDKFILLGTGSTLTEKNKEVVVAMDLSGLLGGTCNDNDFETWGMNECFLGQKMTFYRIKATSNCKVGGRSWPSPKIETCQCTDADFECDSGYYRNLNKQCEAFPGYVFDNKCGGSSGFKKRKMSACTGGLNKEAPNTCSSGHSFWFYLFFVVLPISAVIAGIYYYVIKKREGFISLPLDNTPPTSGVGEFVQGLKALGIGVGVVIISLVGKAKDKISDMMGRSRNSYMPVYRDEGNIPSPEVLMDNYE